MREADVSDGSRVPHGSTKHIKDLEARIAGLVQWRDKQKKGSEARANYARLISRLKGELASARRAAAKRNLKENYATEPDPEDVARWKGIVKNRTSDDYANSVIDSVMSAHTTDDLDRVRNEVSQRRQDGAVSSLLSADFVNWLCAARAKQLGA